MGFRDWLSEATVVAYHGSRSGNPLSELKPGEGGQWQRVAGVYLSKNRQEALKYTKEQGKIQPQNLYRVVLDLRNPAGREVLDELGYRLNGIEMRDELIRRGYDSVVDDFMDEIVIFYPERQVVSITAGAT